MESVSSTHSAKLIICNAFAHLYKQSRSSTLKVVARFISFKAENSCCIKVCWPYVDLGLLALAQNLQDRMHMFGYSIVEVVMNLNQVRCAGVIWFIFLVLRRLLNRFTSSNLCCGSISMTEYQQKIDRKSDLP
jgi:hypothetical protein